MVQHTQKTKALVNHLLNQYSFQTFYCFECGMDKTYDENQLYRLFGGKMSKFKANVNYLCKAHFYSKKWKKFREIIA